MRGSIYLLYFAVGFVSVHLNDGLKTQDVKNKRGTVSAYGSSTPYGSSSSPYGSSSPYSSSVDYGTSSAGSGFTPITSPVHASYPHLSAVLIPGNFLYGHGLDYGGYSGLAAIPTAYPIGLNLAPTVPAYKLGPVTFAPNPAQTAYVSHAAAYPSYSYPAVPSLAPDYAIGPYSSASHYPSSSPYSSSHSYGSGSSYPSGVHSYSSSGQSSPSYAAFAGSSGSGTSGGSYASYSSPSYASPSTGSSYGSYSGGASSYGSSPYKSANSLYSKY